MATTAFVIHSSYDPADRERLERETGQYEDSAEAWEMEAKRAFKSRLAPAPRFVPASGAYGTVSETKEPVASTSEDVGSWYRSLHNSVPPSTRSTPAPTPAVEVPRIPIERRTKNNWFISNALNSQPIPAPTPGASLADILARDPPPLPHQAQHKPPVWLALGPGNRGFSMLQNSGWQEGEALGAHADVARRESKRRRTQQASSAKPTQASELQSAIIDVDDASRSEIVDLTMSSDEEDVSEDQEGGDEEEQDDGIALDQKDLTHGEGDDLDGGRRALVTPLGVVLKSDRLGIGLKAKTVGPYKASQKRITPNAKALAAHIRASEQLRKEKQRNGRGKRGFARQHKREQSKRQALMAYMNEL
ncbi:G-patch domain-containing protein [Mycena chlorophos]|uniref:G-patch domain-containing protein n=1 Tax=Mycena chlorophos TaxID=658473 RepID=A0A8H6VUB9_MYCCL|nr:G-patch domain-containing protein [Mycena chlorophos]